MHVPVVAAAEQRAVGGEESSADRDAALGEPGAGLGERDVQQDRRIGQNRHRSTLLAPPDRRNRQSVCRQRGDRTSFAARRYQQRCEPSGGTAAGAWPGS
ncbi:MAG: hypothetical protein ACRDRH_25700 [Pseudonocardia sp.]